MFYEVACKRTNGLGKVISESYLVSNVLLFGEAETAIITKFDMAVDVCGVKRSKVLKVINKPSAESGIFVASVMDRGNESDKWVKYEIAVYAQSIEEATQLALNYANAAEEIESIVTAVRESKFVEHVIYMQ